MDNHSNKNVRIAKNSTILYIRMFVSMLVSFYTSRVVLDALGIVDFGIYNVVGGVVAVFSLITGPLRDASVRFVTFYMGKGNIQSLSDVCGASLFLHLLLSVVVVVLSESIGLWFILEKMQIPAERVNASIYVYQFSIITTVISLINVPYYAIIIASEKLTFFAIVSMFEVSIKLLISIMIQYSNYDKLILYSFLLMLVYLVIYLSYVRFTKKNSPQLQMKVVYKRDVLCKIGKFVGWTVTGGLSGFLNTQGLNILLNTFFGPVVNAARGIAIQIQGAINNFCSNIMVAINPQIIKSYAQNDLDRMHKLIIFSSKLTFTLLLTLSLPVMLKTEYILQFWLGRIPEHTVFFTIYTLSYVVMRTLCFPIITAVHSTGNLKIFQISEGVILCLAFPISYIWLDYFNGAPVCVFITLLIIEILAQITRVIVVLPKIKMSYVTYITRVIVPLAIGSIMIVTTNMTINAYIDNCLISLIIISVSGAIVSVITFYFVCCDTNEKLLIKNIIKHNILKK